MSSKLDMYTRFVLIAIGMMLVAVVIYMSTVRIELSTERFNELRSYLAKRDAEWLPFISRTQEHLDQQDNQLRSFVEVFSEHDKWLKAFLKNYEETHPKP
jgi:hypothetical protein